MNKISTAERTLSHLREEKQKEIESFHQKLREKQQMENRITIGTTTQTQLVQSNNKMILLVRHLSLLHRQYLDDFSDL